MDEATVNIQTRKDLIYWLSEASELEHALCAAYLFTVFTLKSDLDEGGMTEAQLTKNKEWKKNISEVAIQEMLHLGQASAFLQSIGSVPHFQRPAFPINSNYYPTHIQLELLTFQRIALKRFICFERPEIQQEGDMDDEWCFDTELQETHDGSGELHKAFEDETVTIGELYSSIFQGFKNLIKNYNGDASKVFIGPPGAQIPTDVVIFKDLNPIKTIKDVEGGIESIIEQGEGSAGHIENSHFAIFHKILNEFETMVAEDPNFIPQRPVVPNPTLDPRGIGSVITDPDTRRIMQIFNDNYELALSCLLIFFSHGEEHQEGEQLLVSLGIELMVQAIRPLGELITKLPAGEEYPGQTAGPSFEIGPNLNFLSYHGHTRWRYFYERVNHLVEDLNQEIEKNMHSTILTGVRDFLKEFSMKIEPWLFES